MALTTIFLIIEIVAGFITQSLALLSDAAHMFTDAAALAIALVAIKIAKRPADDKRTFGYQRFEILAALFNACMLFVVAIYILYEAYQRLSQPRDSEPWHALRGNYWSSDQSDLHAHSVFEFERQPECERGLS